MLNIMAMLWLWLACVMLTDSFAFQHPPHLASLVPHRSDFHCNNHAKNTRDTALSMNNGFFSFFQPKPAASSRNNAALIATKKQALVEAIAKCPMNGVNTKKALVQEVDAIARELEALNPTVYFALFCT